MAFMISKTETSYSDSEKEKEKEKEKANASLNHSEEKDGVTRQLFLRSSSRDSSSSEALDKEEVLKRIRHHKRFNKVKNAFQALVSSSSSASGQIHPNIASTTVLEEKWLNQDDAFSSP